MIKLKMYDYITINERRYLYKEAMEFALKKKNGKILNRTNVIFLPNDTEEETNEKLKYHAKLRYIGSVGQRLFINYIRKEIGYIRHDIIYRTKKGNIGDVDTITPSGLQGDIKTSFFNNMNIPYNDVINNDFFVKIKLNTYTKEFTICGFITREEILNNVEPTIKGDNYIVYNVKEYQLNTNIEQLKAMYIKK